MTARGLAEMPALAESLAEGRLNVEHAAIVADAAEQVTPEVAEALVKTAEAMPADLFARKAREFVGKHTSATETEERHASSEPVERAGTRPMATARSRSTHGSTKPPANRSSPRGDDAPTACGTKTAAATAPPTTDAPMPNAGQMPWPS